MQKSLATKSAYETNRANAQFYESTRCPRTISVVVLMHVLVHFRWRTTLNLRFIWSFFCCVLFRQAVKQDWIVQKQPNNWILRVVTAVVAARNFWLNKTKPVSSGVCSLLAQSIHNIDWTTHKPLFCPNRIASFLLHWRNWSARHGWFNCCTPRSVQSVKKHAGGQ